MRYLEFLSLKAVWLTNAGSGTHISELADNGMAASVDGSSIVLPDTTSIPRGRGEPFDNVITVLKVSLLKLKLKRP